MPDFTRCGIVSKTVTDRPNCGRTIFLQVKRMAGRLPTADTSTSELETALFHSSSVEQYLEENAGSLQAEALSQRLGRMLKKHHLRRKDVISACKMYMSDIYVHQIFSGKRMPSRDRLLCILLSMKLPVQEVQDTLKSCGYAALYAKNARDSIILYACYHQLSLPALEELLAENREPPVLMGR